MAQKQEGQGCGHDGGGGLLKVVTVDILSTQTPDMFLRTQLKGWTI
jgi:hypothetical protein